MWKLLDLYKTDLDKWREYLYRHMSIFSWWKDLLNIWYASKDIYNDIFLVIDRCILNSIEEYEEKQIYKYIKTRVRWELINRRNKSMTEVWLHLMPSEVEDWEFMINSVDNSYMYKIVSEEIMNLDEPYKTIMILKHLVRPQKSFKQIWLTLQCSEQQAMSNYNQAIKFIQDKLKDENIY